MPTDGELLFIGLPNYCIQSTPDQYLRFQSTKQMSLFSLNKPAENQSNKRYFDTFIHGGQPDLNIVKKPWLESTQPPPCQVAATQWAS